MQSFTDEGRRCRSRETFKRHLNMSSHSQEEFDKPVDAGQTWKLNDATNTHTLIRSSARLRLAWLRLHLDASIDVRGWPTEVDMCCSLR